MRILLAITGLGVGGAERMVASLADHFVEIGHEVLLVVLHGQVELRPQNENVRIVNLHMRRDPLGILIAGFRFRRLIKNFHPHVVNSHMVHANIFTRVLRLVTPMAILVSSAHNTNDGGLLRVLAYRLTDRLTNISTNVTEEAVEAFEKRRALRPGRMVAVHNGIDTQKFAKDLSARYRVRKELGVNEVTPVLLAVGSLCEQKDYPNMLEALALLLSVDESVSLWVAGDGPLKEAIGIKANELNVAHNVKFLGLRRDVRALMGACDFYVMSSAWEGLPMVILEAMSSECLVISTDCGGIRRVVGEAGFIVPPRDSNALAASLTQALSLSETEREHFGKAGRGRVVENFSLNVTAKHYLAVYERFKQDDVQHSDGG